MGVLLGWGYCKGEKKRGELSGGGGEGRLWGTLERGARGRWVVEGCIMMGQGVG